MPWPKRMTAALFTALIGWASERIVEADVRAAGERLKNPEPVKQEEKAAVAEHSEAAYCTAPFKQVLERVLNACGLLGQESRRGCQPADVKNFAEINDADFVALFTPLKDRGAIVANIIMSPTFQDKFSVRYHNTFASVLPVFSRQVVADYEAWKPLKLCCK